jgi:hypothetical protein
VFAQVLLDAAIKKAAALILQPLKNDVAVLAELVLCEFSVELEAMRQVPFARLNSAATFHALMRYPSHPPELAQDFDSAV